MASGLLPAYLALGQDQLKRETSVKRLKKRLQEGLEAFNLDERQTAADIEPTDIAISLNTLPVGDGFRLVIIHEAHKLLKDTSETIISYLTNPNPDCVLLLDSESLKKTTRLYKAIAKVGNRAVIDCSPIAEKNLPGYLKKRASAKGFELDHAAALELANRVGTNTTLLDTELDTLGALAGDSRHITQELVRDNVARTADVKPWEFLNRVCARDTRGALEMLELLGGQNQLGLLTLLTRNIRDLICARSLIDRGQSAQIASEIGKSDWQARSVTSNARKYTSQELTHCLAACARCEQRIKGGSDPETSMVELVVTICTPGV